jgi:uncharacterized protein YqgC (DUF456 family)
MSGWGELIVALVCVVGIAGTIVPVLPGALLVLGAILVWAAVEGGATAWTVAAVAALLVGIGQVVKYLWPGRRMKAAGVPGSTLIWGGVLGVVGFFVVPVIGLALGFVLGVWLAEVIRLGGTANAWPSTVHALKAAGLSMLVELASALVATSVWATAAVLT